LFDAENLAGPTANYGGSAVIVAFDGEHGRPSKRGEGGKPVGGERDRFRRPCQDAESHTPKAAGLIWRAVRSNLTIPILPQRQNRASMRNHARNADKALIGYEEQNSTNAHNAKSRCDNEIILLRSTVVLAQHVDTCGLRI
jgi:hypothetical protein